MEFLIPLLMTLPSPAWGMIGVSLSFSIAMVSLNFMIAYAFQSPQMVAIAREELAAMILTMFILFFWTTSDGVLNGLANGLLLAALPPDITGSFAMNSMGLTTGHLDLALSTVDITIQKLKDQYVDLYLFEALIGFLSTISFPLGSPVPAVNVISFSLAPFTGLVMLSNAHTIIVEAIGYLITMLWAKQFLLIFARDAVPVLLLPLGLVMRAFPFFRRTGSSIIAVSFAMYFVFPFAIILSNFLMFDIYQPADFSYTPSSASFFGTDRNAADMESALMGGRQESNQVLEEFTSPTAVQEAASDPGDECAGNAIWQLLCSFGNIMSSAFHTAAEFVQTVWNIWKFMVGMTGDFFFTFLNNPLMPASASAGLFHFIIQEVMLATPFVVMTMVVSLFEIIITVTAYRSVSLAIGGEAELVGLTKVV